VGVVVWRWLGAWKKCVVQKNIENILMRAIIDLTTTGNKKYLGKNFIVVWMRHEKSFNPM